jgi:hypothetical protein
MVQLLPAPDGSSNIGKAIVASNKQVNFVSKNAGVLDKATGRLLWHICDRKSINCNEALFAYTAAGSKRK